MRIAIYRLITAFVLLGLLLDPSLAHAGASYPPKITAVISLNEQAILARLLSAFHRPKDRNAASIAERTPRVTTDDLRGLTAFLAKAFLWASVWIGISKSPMHTDGRRSDPPTNFGRSGALILLGMVIPPKRPKSVADLLKVSYETRAAEEWATEVAAMFKLQAESRRQDYITYGGARYPIRFWLLPDELPEEAPAALIYFGRWVIIEEEGFQKLPKSLRGKLRSNLIRMKGLTDRDKNHRQGSIHFGIVTAAALAHEDLEGKRLIDAGAGDGLLSLIGLVLGAEDALLIEYDSELAALAKENLRLNGLQSRARVEVADLTDKAAVSALVESLPRRSTVVVGNLAYYDRFTANNGHIIDTFGSVTEVERMILGGHKWLNRPGTLVEHENENAAYWKAMIAADITTAESMGWSALDSAASWPNQGVSPVSLTFVRREKGTKPPNSNPTATLLGWTLVGFGALAHLFHFVFPALKSFGATLANVNISEIVSTHTSVGLSFVGTLTTGLIIGAVLNGKNGNQTRRLERRQARFLRLLARLPAGSVSIALREGWGRIGLVENCLSKQTKQRLSALAARVGFFHGAKTENEKGESVINWYGSERVFQNVFDITDTSWSEERSAMPSLRRGSTQATHRLLWLTVIGSLSVCQWLFGDRTDGTGILSAGIMAFPISILMRPLRRGVFFPLRAAA